MKINPAKFNEISPSYGSIKQDNKPAGSSCENPVTADSGQILSSYAKAIQNIKNSADIDFEEMKEKAKELIREYFSLIDSEIIHRYSPDYRNKILRFQIGPEIEGFHGLYDSNKFASCYYDDDGEIKCSLLKNKKTKEVDFIDFTSGKHIYYDTNDFNSLFFYKYHPDYIHIKLRENRNIYGGDFKEESDNAIKTLTEMFDNEAKILRNNEDTVLYRAIESYLTEDDIARLSTKGAVFTEKSFCSTTTNLSVAQRFNNNKNPILQIEFPKGSKYIDVEKIFNIDRQHWKEDEFLLDRDSMFLVTGFDEENNIIKVKYIGTKE